MHLPILFCPVFCDSNRSWINLPAVTREDQSTPNLLQLCNDPSLLILPGLHDGRDCVTTLMAEKSTGTDALQPKQFQHPDCLSSHAAGKINGTAE